MPFEKIGPCPFEGCHWPPQWGEQRITPKTFPGMPKEQKTDLIEFFCDQDLRKVGNSRPRFRIGLNALQDYFGKSPRNLQETVTKSEEYKDYFAKRQRLQAPPPPPPPPPPQPPETAPPPPPEMSLLTRVRIAAYRTTKLGDCLATLAERAESQDKADKDGATAAQVVRKGDRAGKGISFSQRLPRNDEKFTRGQEKRGLDDLGFDKDPSRIMVCNMQRDIEGAADQQFGEGGRAVPEHQKIFEDLVEAEKAKEATVRKDAYAPYRARAALGLVLLLSSVLW